MSEGFPSAYTAVGWAYRRVNTPIITKPSIFYMGAKTRMDFNPTLTPWDKVAEAAFILKNLERVCKPMELLAVRLYFCGDEGDMTTALATYLGRRVNKDRWFVRDALLQWSTGRPKHTSRWWAKRYDIGQTTVVRWSKKIRGEVDKAFKDGLNKAEEALEESGHIVRL